MQNDFKRVTINLEEYVLKAAEEKAKIMFRGSLDDYINYLICSNNVAVIKKAVKREEARIEKLKPTMLEGSVKSAMYNNVCDFCKRPIYQGEEICKAEGYESYIHKKCCKDSR